MSQKKAKEKKEPKQSKKEEATLEESQKSFVDFDKNFQEKIVQAMLMDKVWAAQFSEVLNVSYFHYAYLRFVANEYIQYYLKYKEFPSMDLLLAILKTKLKAEASDSVLKEQIKELLIKVEAKENLGDLGYVKEKSLDFCKKASLQKALEQSVDFIQTENYDKVVEVVKNAIAAGNEHDPGLELSEDIEARYSETYRHTVGTGIQELDQKKILNGGLGSGELGIVVAPTSCHVKGAKVLMHDGTLKNVENIIIGDKLMGPDSKPRTVLQLHFGTDLLYKIIPYRGTPFVVNQNHILSLRRTFFNKKYPNKKTKKIVNIKVKDYLEKSKAFKHIHKLYRCEAIDFEKNKERNLPISPYILGVLLGDGYLNKKRIELTSKDKEVINEFYDFAEQSGLAVSIHKCNTCERTEGYYLTNNGKHNNPVVKKLESLDLLNCTSGDKFIPTVYKTATLQERRQLLAGLIDTDGHRCNKSTYEITTKSFALAQDILFLCGTLGLMATIKNKKVAKYPQNTYYKIHISGKTFEIPCRIPRKKMTLYKKRTNALNVGFKVEESGFGKYYGFTLNDDHLYMLDNFIVNHNCGKTHFLIQLGCNALRVGKNVIHYTFELNERATGIRYDSNLLDIPSLECYGRQEDIRNFYEKNRKKLGHLRIKYFSTGEASCQTLRMHIEKLNLIGFYPELVIVDYAQIMKSTERFELLRLELKRICEELRALARELDCPIWTAIQSNKEGTDSEVVNLTNMAESYGQAHIADFVVGLSRKQDTSGFGCMFVAKNRMGLDKIKYPIHLDTAKSKLRVLTEEEASRLREKNDEDALEPIRRKFQEMCNNGK